MGLFFESARLSAGGERGRERTTQDGAVSREEAVLEGLLDVALLEGLLLCDNLVQVLAGVDGHLVAAVAVVDAEESQALVSFAGLAFDVGLQVEDAGVGILHADAPALHRGRAEDEVLAIAGL